MVQDNRGAIQLRRKFVVAGALLGAAFSFFYLYRIGSGASVVPDPVWLRFVNVALIMFCSIYLANAVRRLVERGRK